MTGEVFVRPHLRACQECVEISVDVEGLRSFASLAEFVAALGAELKAVYGMPEESLQSVRLLYATAAEPEQFSSALDAVSFDRLKQYDESVILGRLLKNEHDEAVAQHEAIERERDPEKKKNRQQRHEEKQRLANIASTQKQWKLKEYETACLKQKLKNVFTITAIRVYLE